jgi:hypothetical protein
MGMIQNAFQIVGLFAQWFRIFNRFAPPVRALPAGTNGRHRLHEFS